jgi:spermidine/putrescine ABC transporter ATP-binding subunit
MDAEGLSAGSSAAPPVTDGISAPGVVARPAVGLEVRGVTKLYGKVRALDDVDLAVLDGELLTILGPSGSGKTTLLKVIAGFEAPQAGSLLVDGRDLVDESPARRDIGMVFQHYALFPHMTVAQNVAFPLEMRRIGAQEIESRVAEALAMVELEGFSERLPSQLSGGQQQRVALARAIVFKPRLLLLDEPFGALDRKLRETMQLEVRRLQRQLGLTTLFITHDQEEALIMSDRIAVMNGGSIIQVGAPGEIYERPRDAFVADFVGESNLLDGEVLGIEPDAVLVGTPSGLRLRAASAPLPVGARLKLLIRPERLTVGSEGRQANAFAGRVQELVYLGQSWKARIELEGGAGELLARWPSESGGEPVEPGALVRLGCSAEDVRIVQVS